MTYINAETPESICVRIPVSQEQLQCEMDYIRSQRLLESILKEGLISLSEFNKITMLNRQSFSPALASIMPEKR